MSVTITALEAENVKRIKAVALTPAPTGLTLVGGNNNQGKTSVLDALAWALGFATAYSRVGGRASRMARWRGLLPSIRAETCSSR